MVSINDQRLRYPFHQRVYVSLSVKELFSLAASSKTFQRDVEEFCEGICNRLKLVEKVCTLLNRQPALREDDALRERFRRGRFTHRWLFSVWRRFRSLFRQSISNIWFAQAGHPKYIPIYYDKQLYRDVVELKSVCWLQLRYVFRHVEPGCYRATIRMEVNHVSSTHHVAPGMIGVHWSDEAGYHQRVCRVKWNQWKLLREQLGVSEGLVASHEGGILSDLEVDTGWFNFSLEGIEVASLCDVTFEFNDAGWKSGMRWDYLQLKCLDWNIRT